jgi:hypothetical protein
MLDTADGGARVDPAGRSIIGDKGDRPTPHSTWLAATIHMSASGAAIRIGLLQAVSGSSLNAGECRILLKALTSFRTLFPVGR